MLSATSMVIIIRVDCFQASFLGNGGEFVLMQMVCGFQSLIQYVLVSRLCFCTCQALIVWKKRFHYSRSSDTLISWHQRKVSRYT